jgi:hypothetical protein
MAQREPNRKLEEVMRLAGCTNSGLAKRVIDVASGHGVEVHYDHVNVKRWLAGTQPRGLTPSFIAEALSRKLGRPVSLADIGIETHDGGLLPGADRYAERLSESVEAVSALVRADLVGSAGGRSDTIDSGAWSDLMIRWLVAPDTMIAATSPVTDTATEAVTRATTLFSQLDYQFGGGYARSSLVQYVNTEIAPLLVARPNSQTPELLSAASALLRLTGWTAYDTGNHVLAHRYLLQALRLAQAAGDRALGGRILAGMSHQANFLGYHDSAVNLARTARHGAEGVATPTAMALFHAMEARALASRGDRRDCESALVRAEYWLDRRVPENDPAWLQYFDEAELAAEFAHSYRDLKMSDKAIEYAQIAIAAHDPLYVRSISFCKAVQAAGHLGKGEMERGIELAEEVAAVVSALRSGRCTAYMQDFARRLQPYEKHSLVADFVGRNGTLLAIVA